MVEVYLRKAGVIGDVGDRIPIWTPCRFLHSDGVVRYHLGRLRTVGRHHIELPLFGAIRDKTNHAAVGAERGVVVVAVVTRRFDWE